MNQQTRVPIPVTKCVQIAGIMGLLIGLVFASVNDEGFAWGLLKGAILGVLFALITRHFLTIFVRYWLETRMDTLIEEHHERVRLYEEEKKTLKSNKKSRSEVKNDSSRKKED